MFFLILSFSLLSFFLMVVRVVLTESELLTLSLISECRKSSGSNVGSLVEILDGELIPPDTV